MWSQRGQGFKFLYQVRADPLRPVEETAAMNNPVSGGNQVKFIAFAGDPIKQCSQCLPMGAYSALVVVLFEQYRLLTAGVDPHLGRLSDG